MSILVSAHQLTHSYSTQSLFSELSLVVETGDRVGLIGPNGAGKSTLLRILAQEISPDKGELFFQRGLKVGFLKQTPEFQPGQTLLSGILEGTDDPDDWSSLGLAQEYYSRLGLDVFPEDFSIDNLSGGWRKRVALARELVKKPDLLILDEPTNHLDVDGIMWLETFLKRAPFAVLTVTHDRVFLQRVANRMIELDRRHPGGMLDVRGDYLDYVRLREQMISAQEKREVVLKNTLRRETEWLRQGAKARTTKQQARIKQAETLKGEVESLEDRNRKQKVKLQFHSEDQGPKKLIVAQKISKAYGDESLFSGVDLSIGPQSRIGFLGPNGAGKSTLIRVLMGQEKPSSGTIEFSDRLSIAYFDQTRETLDPEKTVAETLCGQGDYVDERGKRVHIRGYLDRFLFSPDQANVVVGKLSGGEQSRLLIARLMLTEANVLVLDEPTNDLDLATLSALEESLKQFPGAVLLVTHDRYFLDRVVNQLIAFPPASAKQKEKLEVFSDFFQWEAWYGSVTQEEIKIKNSPVKKEASAQIAKKKKRSFKEEYELKNIEPRIEEAELELEQATTQCSLPEVMADPKKLSEWTQKMAEFQEKVDSLYSRWAELSGELEIDSE